MAAVSRTREKGHAACNAVTWCRLCVFPSIPTAFHPCSLSLSFSLVHSRLPSLGSLFAYTGYNEHLFPETRGVARGVADARPSE